MKAQKKKLKTPGGKISWDKGFKGTSFDSSKVYKALAGATLIDFETRGLNPYKDPVWAAARLSKHDPQGNVIRKVSDEEYINIMSNFLGKDEKGKRIDYDYIDKHVFGLDDPRWSKGLNKYQKEAQAIEHMIKKMGDPISWQVYESGTKDVENSIAYQSFLKDVPAEVKKGKSPQQLVALYLNPHANPANQSMAFLHGPKGPFTKIAKDIAKLTGAKVGAEDIERIRTNFIERLHMGQNQSLQDWMTGSFKAARESSRTILVHNLNFESKFAAARTNEDFRTKWLEKEAYSYSGAKKDMDNLALANRFYTTSSALTNAKTKAMRSQSFDDWQSVFGEWIHHASEKSKRVKILDTMDLGRAVFGMAQQSLGRAQAYNWKDTRSFYGLSMDAYAESVGKALGLPKHLRNEAHLARADVLLEQSYTFDMFKIGEALSKGKTENLNQRHQKILKTLGEINADADRRLQATTKQMLNDVEQFLQNEPVSLRLRDWDPVDGRWKGAYNIHSVHEEDPTKVKSRLDHDRSQKQAITHRNRYKNATSLDELVDYHLTMMNKFYVDKLDKTRFDDARKMAHGLARLHKLEESTGKTGLVAKALHDLQNADALSYNELSKTDAAKRLITQSKSRKLVESAASEMTFSRRVGWAAIGGIAGMGGMRLAMGNEAEQYMADLEGKVHGRQQDKGFWEQVDVGASLGAAAYTGAMVSKNAGHLERLNLSRMLRESMDGKNVSKHLFPMAIAASTLVTSMYAVNSNVKDVVDAEPEGGHPFQIGSVVASAAGLTTLTYGAKYGFPDMMEDVGVKKHEDRVVDRLAKMWSPKELGLDSKVMDDTKKLWVDAGRKLKPAKDWLGKGAAILDPNLTKVRPQAGRSAMREVASAMGRWKAPAVVVGGFAAYLGADALFRSPEETIPSESLNAPYAQGPGMADFGLSKELRDQMTPFGSPFSAAKNLDKFGIKLMERMDDITRIWNPDHRFLHTMGEGSSDAGNKAITYTYLAERAVDLCDAPVVIKHLPASSKRWMNDTWQPHIEATAAAHDYAASRLPRPMIYPKGLGSDLPAGLPSDKIKAMGSLAGPSGDGLDASVRRPEISNVVSESSGNAPMAVDVLVRDEFIDGITDKLAADQAIGFRTRDTKNMLQNIVEESVDLTNSSPSIVQKETSPILDLSKELRTDIIDTRAAVSRAHIDSNAMLLPFAQKAGLKHNSRRSMPAKNTRTYTE